MTASTPGVPAGVPRPISPALTFALVAPVVAVTLLVVYFAVSETLGHTPSSYGRPENIAEAAGMGSGAEVLRLLRQGENPNQVLPIRREIISSTVANISALEAAVWSRHVELVQLLDASGAIADDGVRRHLACLASDLEVRDIVEFLAPVAPACVPGQDQQIVLDRTPKD